MRSKETSGEPLSICPWAHVAWIDVLHQVERLTRVAIAPDEIRIS